MEKPILAILYDFDSTLAKSDMQSFKFIPDMGMSAEEFWQYTGEFCKRTGCEKCLGYLFAMKEVAEKKGIPMTKEYLKECGKKVEFFPGVLTWFDRINKIGEDNGVQVEHYLVSSGNREIIEGTKIADKFTKIYGCEYLFDEKTGLAYWPKLAINFTQKTQYFFRISKGAVDQNDDYALNSKTKNRRIPYSNIVYIGDGMTDIPSMIIVKNKGGRSIAVFQKGKRDVVEEIKNDERVNYTALADYSPNKKLEKIITLYIQSVAVNTALEEEE